MNHVHKLTSTKRMAMTIKQAWTVFLRLADTFLGLPRFILSHLDRQKRRSIYSHTWPHVCCSSILKQYKYQSSRKRSRIIECFYTKTKANCYLSGGNVLFFVWNKRMLDWPSGFLFRWILTVNSTCTKKQTHCHKVYEKNKSDIDSTDTE